eukprot:Gb_03248 [translate_table: standard]
MANIDIDEEHEESPLLLVDSRAATNSVNLRIENSSEYYHTLEHGISRRKVARAVDNGNLEYKRLNSSSKDKLRKFKMALFWVGLHESSSASLLASWTLFLIFSIMVPTAEVLFVTYSSCTSQQIQLDIVVQISESSLAAISFLFLSHSVRKHGLWKLLFLDKIERESTIVQLGFNKELNAALWLLAWILLPCFVAKVICEVWWFAHVSVKVPFIQDKPICSIILCMATLLSWLYQMGLFLFVCVVFRVMCSLQLLRFEDYTRLFEETPEPLVILKEHMRMRQQLSTMSHRFRIFILSSLVAITVSQFISLFITTASRGNIDFLKAGNLVSAANLLGMFNHLSI